MHLGEDTALQALENFVESAECPRWVRVRFEQHNRVRQTRAPRPAAAQRAAAAETREADQAPAEEDSVSRRDMMTPCNLENSQRTSSFNK